MEFFAFASFVLYSVCAVLMFVISMLAFCGNRYVISERTRQYYNVRLCKLYFGLFYLGLSLIAAALAYLHFKRTNVSLLIPLIFLLYGILGSVMLSKSKRLMKNPDMTEETHQITYKEAMTRGWMMLGFYLVLPVLILVWAFVFQ